MTIDLDLALHEAGHVLAYVLRGADLVAVADGADERGHFAVTHGVSTSTTPPGPLPKDELTTCAGPVFSCLFDSRLRDAVDRDLLLVGGGVAALKICAMDHLQIAPDDAEDAAEMDQARLIIEGRRMALLGMSYAGLARAIATQIVDKSQAGKPAAFNGPVLLTLLGDHQQVTALADYPALFQQADSRQNMLETAGELAALHKPDARVVLENQSVRQ